MRFIDQFAVVLLDMNGTFVFGHDRLGPGQDFFATYRALGGRSLEREQVQRVVTDTCSGLARKYEDPACADDFPSVAEALSEQGEVRDTSELAVLEAVIAAHEFGHIPDDHQVFLRELAGQSGHQLSVVSNLWSRPEPWLGLFRDTKLDACFRNLVFSSNGRSMKPSRQLFEQALAGLPRDAGVLFVGDSLRCDIEPAKALGFATVWIAPRGSQHAAADRVIERLVELAELPA